MTDPYAGSGLCHQLGNRKLGELADMVSQFEVDDDYTQINYKGRPVRVTAPAMATGSSGSITAPAACPLT